MIADCRAGKVDRILVKSMSRFARNTSDFLLAMRELTRLGVTIRFEKENIDTGKLTSEQTATIYAGFAQMESTNHSSNMRTSVRMRMERGIFTPSSMPYGYRLNGLEPEIVLEEAEVVRYIFASALRGHGRKEIAKMLNEQGIERSHGRKVWHHTTVHYILTNNFYTGGSVWQKFCTTDTIPFQKMKNKGQKPTYHVEDDHPAIISREDFEQVQALISQRRGQFYENATPSRSVYIGRIFCGQCGSKLRRKVCGEKVYWDCYRHNAGKEHCSSRQITEVSLTAAVLRLHNKLALHGQKILQPLLDQLRQVRELELRSSRKLADIDKEIANISGQNLVLIRLKRKGGIDPALALSQADALSRRLKDLRRLRRKVLDTLDEDQQIQATEAMLDYLECAQWRDEAPPDLFETLVERITVASAEEVKFRLLSGLELTERLV